MSNATISTELRQRSIERHGPCKWSRHWYVMAAQLGLADKKELKQFLKTLPFEVKDVSPLTADNAYQFHCQTYGRKEGAPDLSEPTPLAVYGGAEFYSFGLKKRRHAVVGLGVQIEIIRSITGSARDLGDNHGRRRADQWRACLERGERNDFYTWDLPVIIKQFHEVWDTRIKPTVTKIPVTAIKAIVKEMATLLRLSYVLPLQPEEESILLRESQRGSEDTGGTDDDSDSEQSRNQVTPQPRRDAKRRRRDVPGSLASLSNDRQSSLPSTSTGRPTSPSSVLSRASRSSRATAKDTLARIPALAAQEDAIKAAKQMLTRTSLKRKWDVEKGYREVGSLEIAVEHAHRGSDRFTANAEIAKLGGIVRPVAEWEAICGIPKTELYGKLQQFEILKVHIQESLPEGLFRLQEEQKLLDWMNVGKEISNGNRPPPPMLTISKANSQPALTEAVAHIIRHIIVGYDIPMSKFCGLLNCFAPLLLGRALEQEEFPSTATIRLWIKRLAIVDNHRVSVLDRAKFGFTSEHGFPVLWYFVSDDTVHGKHDKRHGLIRVSVDEEGKPKYVVLTSSKAVSADAQGNSDLNLAMLTEKVHKDVLPFLGGATVDGAASAHSEVVITCTGLMEHLKTTGGPYRFWEEDRLPVIIPDFFHADNVAINGASSQFSGDPEKGNSRQFHPLQFLESIHDVHSVNKVFSQQVIDKLLQKLSKEQLEALVEYILKTVRERKQRWRVNGLYAKRILEAVDIVLPDGENLITHWAREMQYLGGTLTGADSKWMKQTCEEVMVMSMSDTIIVSLTFEMELVTNYFDITHGHHAYSGELKRRSGFITLELHFLYLDFVVPFWLTAVATPEKCFPQTVQRIEALADPEKKAQKYEQLQAAVECGLDKISKNLELLLEAPLIFLLLTHPVEGPKVLRAILACLADQNFDPDDVQDYDGDFAGEYDEEAEWGTHNWANVDEAPAGDRVYMEQLLPDSALVTKWWKLLGLARLCVRDELKALSRESHEPTPDRDPTSASRLEDFKATYPVIFEALDSAFGLSSSNSRVIENLHGFVKSFYNAQTPLEFLDNKLNYLMGDEHKDRDERRGVFWRNRDPSLASAPAKHLDRKESQQMQGPQLLKKARTLYSQEKMDALPDDVQEERKTNNILKQGTTALEKTYESNVRVAWEEKHRKKRARGAKQLDIAEMQRKADGKISEHDRHWHNKEERQYYAVQKKVHTITHFKSIDARGPDFHNELRAVLPFFDFEVNGKPLNKTKITGTGGILGQHLKLITKISKGEAENTLNDTDLSDMSEEEIVSQFVLAKKSIKLEQIKKELAEKWRKVKGIFESAAGQNMHPFFAAKMKQPVEDDGTWDEGEDEDGQDE